MSCDMQYAYIYITQVIKINLYQTCRTFLLHLAYLITVTKSSKEVSQIQNRLWGSTANMSYANQLFTGPVRVIGTLQQHHKEKSERGSWHNLTDLSYSIKNVTKYC